MKPETKEAIEDWAVAIIGCAIAFLIVAFGVTAVYSVIVWVAR